MIGMVLAGARTVWSPVHPDAATAQSYTQPHLTDLFKLARFLCISPLISFYTGHGSTQKNKIEILKVSTLKIPPNVRHHGNLNLLPKTRPHLPHLFLHRSPCGHQCVPCPSSAALTFSLHFLPSRTSQPRCKLTTSRDSRGPPTTLPAIFDPRLDAIHHRFLHRHLQRPVLHRHSSSVF
jgi:hypothetical protein